MTIAGRELEMHVAPFAASEADLWVYDRKTRVALVGDLVVDIVPFMDRPVPMAGPRRSSRSRKCRLKR